MATAFTVRQALFLSSVFLFSACGGQIELQSFNTDSLRLENRNGIAYNEGKAFSGSVFELSKTHDTIAVSSFYKGQEHGQWKRFYPGGRLEELRYFEKGVKVKTLTRWWENGQMQLICSFRNGEYDGILKEWNESGQLTKKMHYKNGYEDGGQKMYYDNGKIRSNYVVKDGQRIGLLGTKNCVNVSDSVFKK